MMLCLFLHSVKRPFTSAEEFAEARCESRRPVPRKRWAAEPSDTARQMLADASLASSDSEPSTDQPGTGQLQQRPTAQEDVQHQSVISCVPVFFPGASEEPEGSRPRRRWEKDPPERLLALLEKARLSRASSTFLIHSGGLMTSQYVVFGFRRSHFPSR